MNTMGGSLLFKAGELSVPDTCAEIQELFIPAPLQPTMIGVPVAGKGKINNMVRIGRPVFRFPINYFGLSAIWDSDFRNTRLLPFHTSAEGQNQKNRKNQTWTDQHKDLYGQI